ncbi:MAG: PhnD/SsuA/transferrin family substrate-binding protein, partial [Burkholderiaceae bacterium]
MLLALAASPFAPRAQPPQWRFSVHPYDTPGRLFARFRPLCDYLQEPSGAPIELQIAGTYEQQIADVAQGRVHLAYMGPTPYLRARARGTGLRLLAAEAIDGVAAYRAAIVVRADSPLQSLAELRGRSVAFGNPISFGSFVVPRFMLMTAGVSLADLAYFRHLQRHEQVALAVLHRDFDAGGLRLDVVQPYLARGLRVLARSDPLPPHVIVATRAVPVAQDAALRAVVLRGAGARAMIGGADIREMAT